MKTKIISNNYLNSEIILFGFKDNFLNKIAKKIELNNSIAFFSWTNSNLLKTKKNLFDVFLLCKPILLKKYLKENCKKTEYNNFVRIFSSNHKEYNECKFYFNTMIKRVFIKKLKIEQSKDYFFDLLYFWVNIFTNQKLKLIIFDSSPHFPWDVVAFFVAKQLKIKTLILKRTLISDQIVFSTDFREGKSFLIENFKTNNIILNNHEINQSYWNEYSKNLIQSRINNSKKKYMILFKLKHIITTYFTNIFNLKKSYYNLNIITYTYFLIFHFFKKIFLRSLWKKNIIHNHQTNKKIIYFPLHFQPERSTDPEAFIYSDQFMAIETLSKYIPKNWEIWVKEHPRQNPIEFPNIRRLHYRNPKDYYKLISISNVKLLDVNFSSELGLKISHLVASCTGSILWEGLLCNKSVIRFGTTWHDSCKSCYYIKDVINNKNFFNDKKIFDIKNIKQNVDLFINDLSNYAINSSNSELFAKKSKISENLLISNFVTFLTSYIKSIEK